jgi:undecaprenyl-diphosphatase
VQETGYSFPSGHATAAALFFSLMIYLSLNHIHSKIRREVAITCSIILIVLVGASRLYLGVHWFGDVAAGYALGVFWFTFMVLVIRYMEALTRGRKAKELH